MIHSHNKTLTTKTTPIVLTNRHHELHYRCSAELPHASICDEHLPSKLFSHIKTGYNHYIKFTEY
jgi:hypothetical protein